MKKNFIYQILYQILAILLPIVTSPYITRVLGVENIGIYSYTNSIVSYFMMFAMLGFNTYGMRSIAQVRDNKDKLDDTFSSIYYLQFCISIIILVIYILYINIFIEKYKLFFIIQIIFIAGCIFDINWFYFGIEKFKVTVIRNTIVKMVTLVSIFTFVKNSNDLWKYTLIMTTGTIISQLIMWSVINKHVSFIRVPKDKIISNLKPVLILFIPTIALSIYKTMDKIMLGSISGAVQVGYYENSEKLINIILGVITALGTVMMSRMSNIAVKNNRNITLEYIRKFMSLVMFISVAMSFGLIAISDVFVPLFYGGQFTSAVKLIVGLAITIPFSAFASVIRMQYLIPFNREKEYITSLICGAISNFIVNFIFIRSYGALGAVLGTIIAEITVCLAQIGFAYKELEIIEYLKLTFKFCIIGFIMLISVKYIMSIVQNSLLSVIVGVIVGIIVYFLGGIIYFNTSEKKYIIKNKESA